MAQEPIPELRPDLAAVVLAFNTLEQFRGLKPETDSLSGKIRMWPKRITFEAVSAYAERFGIDSPERFYRFATLISAMDDVAWRLAVEKMKDNT